MVYLKLTRYFILIQMKYNIHCLFQVDQIFNFYPDDIHYTLFISSWPDILFLSRWYTLYMVYFKLTIFFTFHPDGMPSIHFVWSLPVFFPHLDDVPPLEDMSEMLKQAEVIKSKFDISKVSQSAGSIQSNPIPQNGHHTEVRMLIHLTEIDLILRIHSCCPLYQKLTQCYSYGYCIVYIVKFADSHIIFTDQGIVISCLYTIPWLKSLSKSRTWRCLWCKIVIFCQTIRMIFSIRVQWISIFTFHFNEEHVLFTQWEIVSNWFRMMPNFLKLLLSRDCAEY